MFQFTKASGRKLIENLLICDQFEEMSTHTIKQLSCKIPMNVERINHVKQLAEKGGKIRTITHSHSSVVNMGLIWRKRLWHFL